MKQINTAAVTANAIITATKKGDFVVKCTLCRVTTSVQPTPMTMGWKDAVQVARKEIEKGGEFEIIQRIDDFDAFGCGCEII